MSFDNFEVDEFEMKSAQRISELFPTNLRIVSYCMVVVLPSHPIPSHPSSSHSILC